MFGLTDAEVLQHGIKIIDGIAGGAKSSKTDQFFRSHNIPYARFTSTNRLRRDASERYNMDVKTIAAGLFHNHGTNFYAEERDPIAENIVIDEILQTDPRAIEWCVNHADTTNIIITTDSRQLLSPESEYKMQTAFDNLKSMPSTIYRTVTDTLRARDDKTKALYNELYEIAESEMTFNLTSLMKRFHTVIDYDKMEYSPTDAYITHDNLTEDFLYKDKGFISNPLLDLVPKGCIASKPPKDLSTYPILSQMEAERMHARAYTQVMNVGSAVRFQGSEVDNTQKLYYLIQPGSVISARELYTVVTRMWSIDSFVIVVCETPQQYKLKTFNGLPVKTHKYLTLSIAPFNSTVVLSNSAMDEFVSMYDRDDIYFDRDSVRSTKGPNLYIRQGTQHTPMSLSKSSAGSLARRDSKLNYTYMDEVYHIFEENGIDHARGIHKLGTQSESNYEIDVFSAHPTMLKFEKMPSDGFLVKDGPHKDMLNFYLYDGEGGFTRNSIITDDLKSLLDKDHPGHSKYLFSTPYTIGTFPGDWLYTKAHDTQESKKSLKGIHYGYYQKPYLQLSLMGDCYVRYENYKYELLICQIFSQLLYYMLQIYEKLNGVSIVIDAVHFPCYDKNTVDIVKSILPDYVDFRIRTEDRLTVLYKTYEDLPTKEDKKREKERERKRLYRQRKKEEALKMKGDSHNEQKQ